MEAATRVILLYSGKVFLGMMLSKAEARLYFHIDSSSFNANLKLRVIQKDEKRERERERGAAGSEHRFQRREITCLVEALGPLVNLI